MRSPVLPVLGDLQMILIGSGSLLLKTLHICRRFGHDVSTVFALPDPKLRLALESVGVPFVEESDLNMAIGNHYLRPGDHTFLSINNPQILSDEVLRLGMFYNVHNGLVQDFRGVAEVCIFAAVCQGVDRYGATVHRIQSGEQVDAGEVVQQLDFQANVNWTFAQLMSNALRNYVQLIESFLSEEDRFHRKLDVSHSTEVMTLKSVPTIMSKADPQRLRLAREFGAFRHSFPRLVALSGPSTGPQ